MRHSLRRANSSATSTGTDLEGIARSAGVSRTAKVHTIQDFAARFSEALESNDPSVLVAKVEAVGPSSFHMDLSLLENRFQFQRYVKSLEES